MMECRKYIRFLKITCIFHNLQKTRGLFISKFYLKFVINKDPTRKFTHLPVYSIIKNPPKLTVHSQSTSFYFVMYIQMNNMGIEVIIYRSPSINLHLNKNWHLAIFQYFEMN